MRMTKMPRVALAAHALVLSLAVACGGSQKKRTKSPSAAEGKAQPAYVSPPAPLGKPKDVKLPPIKRTKLSNGFEVNAVSLGKLPIVHLLLVLHSGRADDPKGMPGVAMLTARMMKEGTTQYSSAELAQAVERIGADLSVESDADATSISIKATKDHFDEALSLLAEVALRPAFPNAELKKLKQRELDRLALEEKDPNFLAARTFYQRLYQDHPYAHVDTTRKVVKKINVRDLKSWHQQHMLPGNAFFVAVGDLKGVALEASVQKRFGDWEAASAKATKGAFQPALPKEREKREMVVVDRPGSVQSVITIGNLALNRRNPDYVPLKVANQILGGSAASRLFMDLREKRSLTYGAYSSVGARVDQAPFVARASVRTEVTAEALQAFLEHLDRIREEKVPPKELQEAKQYLSDSFSLQIETAQRITSMVADLRVFGLPDDYWETFRSQIRTVEADGAHAAADAYIRPQSSLIVIVGDLSKIKESLAEFGEYDVVKAGS